MNFTIQKVRRGYGNHKATCPLAYVPDSKGTLVWLRGINTIKIDVEIMIYVRSDNTSSIAQLFVWFWIR
jgi:hypothetical protein